jgi:hypothetical protein
LIHPALAHGLRASFWLVVVAVCAGAAAAANLTDLRVGVHGDHTRVVLETDAQAPYIVDVTDREVIVHVDAAAAAEAVTAKSPHLIWAKVEPTPIGADVRLSLKQPAEVKWLVLTGPHRIVLDLYPKQGVPEPLPAPELLEPEPPVVAGTKAGLPDDVPGPSPEELAEAGVADEAPPGPEPEAQAEDGLEPETPAEKAPGALTTPDPDELAAAPEPPAEMEIRVPLPTPGKPVQPAPEPPSGGLFGSPYLLGATAVALFAVFLILRRRLRRPGRPEKYAYPEDEDALPAPYEPPQRAVAVDAPAGEGESLFDVEADVLNAIPKDEERPPRPPPADVDSGDEAERRMAHLERRIEELVDARERLERQVAAQTEELRVQRAAIARTQRVLRTITPRTDEESSEPVVRG